jgi:hypothetical protein
MALFNNNSSSANSPEEAHTSEPYIFRKTTGERKMTDLVQEMVSKDYFFKSAIPVPEKAEQLGLGIYKHVAWRDMKIKVRVTVPKEALESCQVELPEQRRNHTCFMRIKMDEALKDSVTIEVARDDLAKFNLLNVQYIALPKEPGKIVAILELPPNVAVVKRRSQLPRVIHEEYCATQALHFEMNNVVGTIASNQPQGRGRGYGRSGHETRPLNSHVHTMNSYKIDYYASRPKGKEETDYKSFLQFWPQECKLVATVNIDSLVDTSGLVQKDENRLTAIHPALRGAHPNLLDSVYNEHFRTYVIPEYAPLVGHKDHYELHTFDFPRMVGAWDNKKVSETLGGQDKFLPKKLVPQDFFCCMGVDDPINGKNRVTHACFGRLAPIFQTKFRNGSRVIRKDSKGEDMYTWNNSGHLVSIPFKTMYQLLATLYGGFINGRMMEFYEDHLLLFPDDLFAGDDYEARQRNEKLRQDAKSEADETEPENDEQSEDSGNKDSSATPPVGDLDFGDPGIVTEEVEGEQDGGDTDDREPETESSEEESSDDSEDSDSEDSDAKSEASDDDGTESESSSDESSEEEPPEDDNSSSTEDPAPSDNENSAPEDSDAKSDDSNDSADLDTDGDASDVDDVPDDQITIPHG